MPQHHIDLGDGARLAVRDDDFTLPWDSRPPVVMLHGLAESGEAFRRWVPHFGSRHRVIRPDLRGYGDSTPMSADYDYRFAGLGEDIVRMLDALSLDQVYLVGAKIGGALALHLAARYPDRILAVGAVAAPASLKSLSDRAPAWRAQIRERGVLDWVEETTAWRLGSSLSPAAIRWWVELMARSSAATLEAFLRMVPTVDVTEELPRIKCPTVVLTTSGSGLATVEAVRQWQETIPVSQLEVIDDDSYHVAATHPDLCAGLVRRYFDALA